MTYQESLRPPTSVLVVAAALAASFGLIVLPLSAAIAAGVALIFAGAILITLLATSPRITITGTELRAGNAHIDCSHLGTVTPLTRDETRAAFGTKADLRAWSLHRSFIYTAVRVEIADPRDPTPFWLVCTNHPEALATAIESARDQAAHSEQTGSPSSS